MATRTRRMLLLAMVGSLCLFAISAAQGQQRTPGPLTQTIIETQPAATTVTPQSYPGTSPAATSILMQEGFEHAWPTSGWTVVNQNPVNPYGWAKRFCPPHTGMYGETVALLPYGGGAGCLTLHPNNASVAAIYGPFDLSTSVAANMTFYLYGRTSTAKDTNNKPLDSLFVGSSINGQNFAGTSYFGDYTQGSESNSYTRLSLDLTDRLGQSQVWITFWFTSDATGNDIGFTIDDVSINVTADVPPPSPTSTAAPPSPTSTAAPPSPTSTAAPPSPTSTAAPPSPTSTAAPPSPTSAAAPPSPTPFKIYLSKISTPGRGKIVYVHYDTSQMYSIYLMNADGTSQQRVIGCQPEGLPTAIWTIKTCAPALSPDSTHIAFHSMINGDSVINIYSYDLGSRILTRLTDDSASAGFPVWSPDGKQILFVRSLSGKRMGSSLSIIDANGSIPSAPITSDSDFQPAAWSHDGKQIAYSCNPQQAQRNDYSDLCVINTDGTNRRVLVDNRYGAEVAPAWSTTDQRIAYIGTGIAGMLGDLNLVNADGTTKPVTLVKAKVEDSGLTWSPDGASIVFAWRYDPSVTPYGDRTRSDLFVVPSDGSSAPVAVTTNTYVYNFDIDPDWQ